MILLLLFAQIEQNFQNLTPLNILIWGSLTVANTGCDECFLLFTKLGFQAVFIIGQCRRKNRSIRKKVFTSFPPRYSPDLSKTMILKATNQKLEKADEFMSQKNRSKNHFDA